VSSNYGEDFSVIETTTNQTLNNHCFDAFPQPSVSKSTNPFLTTFDADRKKLNVNGKLLQLFPKLQYRRHSATLISQTTNDSKSSYCGMSTELLT